MKPGNIPGVKSTGAGRCFWSLCAKPRGEEAAVQSIRPTGDNDSILPMSITGLVKNQ